MDLAKRNLWRWSSSLLTLAAFAFFCWHGVWRGFSGGYDLAMLYAGSAAWVDGANPYVLQDAAAAMAARGGHLDPTSVVLYPPSALATFAPLTFLGWNAARTVWVGVQLLAFVGLAAGLQRLAGDKLRQGFAAWLFVLALLLWWPIHTGLFLGQVALPVVALVVWGVDLSEKGSRWRSGVLLGIALALKPQLAVVGLGVMVWQWRNAADSLWQRWKETGSSWLLLLRWWRGAGSLSCVVLPVLFFVWGVNRLPAPTFGHSVTGIVYWTENLDRFTHGGYGDVSLPWARAQMTQASTLFAAGGVADATVYGAALAAFLGCFWLLRQWPRRKQVDVLEILAALSLVTLLAVYHRSYDAVLALIPLAHGLRLIAADRRSVAGWGIVVALAVFLTPGGAGLPVAMQGAWWGQFQTMGLILAMVFMFLPLPPARVASHDGSRGL